MACDNCDRLRREIRELKEEIAEYELGTDHEADETDVFRLKIALRIKPQSAKLLHGLMQTPGKLVTLNALAEWSDVNKRQDHDQFPSRTGPGRHIRVLVKDIRDGFVSRGLPSDLIHNAYGRGYILDQTATEPLQALMQEAV